MARGHRGAPGSSAIVFSRAGPEFDADPRSGGAARRVSGSRGCARSRLLAGLDRSAGTRETAWTLVRGVTRLRIEHLGADGRWLDTWPRFGEPEIPRAVRVLLVLASGDVLERWIALR